MKALLFVVAAGLLSIASRAQNPTDAQMIRKLISSFTDDLNKADFSKIAGYGTKDWVHINTVGATTNGRDEVASEIFTLYKNAQKGAKITIENMTIRMLSRDAATVTAINKMDNYTDDTGVKRSGQKQVKTYVVVKQNDKWLLALDQSTNVTLR